MKRLRIVIRVLVLLLVTGGAAWLLSRRHHGERSVSGTVETDEVHVASRYGGRVARITVEEGDALQPGQTIMELDARELQARRAYAAGVLEELEHGPLPEEIAAAKADWESLVAQLQFARAEEQRATKLYAENTIAQTDRDQAVSRARALEQSVTAAEQRHQLLKIGTRPERIEQARAQLAEIDTQLQEMRITAPGAAIPPVVPSASLGGTPTRPPGSVPGANPELGEGLQTPPIRKTEGLPGKGDSVVVNPARSGDRRRTEVPPTDSEYVLEVLSVKVGDVLAANREVATLLLPRHLWVRVYVPETWLGLIRLGDQVAVRTDSTGDRSFTGMVEQINRQAEFTPRNVQTVSDRIRQVFGVKLRLPADTGLLRAGMSVDVVFPNVPPAPK